MHLIYLEFENYDSNEVFGLGGGFENMGKYVEWVKKENAKTIL